MDCPPSNKGSRNPTNRYIGSPINGTAGNNQSAQQQQQLLSSNGSKVSSQEQQSQLPNLYAPKSALPQKSAINSQMQINSSNSNCTNVNVNLNNNNNNNNNNMNSNNNNSNLNNIGNMKSSRSRQGQLQAQQQQQQQQQQAPIEGTMSCCEENLTAIKETLSAHSYKYIRPIGAGGFAAVHLVLSEKYKMEFVVKISPLFKKGDNTAATRASIKASTSLEISNLIALSHQNIIQMYEYFFDDAFVYLILEHCEMGSLQDFIRTQGVLKPPFLFSIAFQILDALRYCHSEMKLAHRDIKPANILLDRNLRPKLADFGISEVYGDFFMIKDFIGTKPFMAPEMLEKKLFDPFKADIWALGVTFYFLASGALPWTQEGGDAMVNQIKLGAIYYSGHWNSQFLKIIKSMTRVNPADRPDAETLIQCEALRSAMENKTPSSFSGSAAASILKRKGGGPAKRSDQLFQSGCFNSGVNGSRTNLLAFKDVSSSSGAQMPKIQMIAESSSANAACSDGEQQQQGLNNGNGESRDEGRILLSLCPRMGFNPAKKGSKYGLTSSMGVLPTFV